jgi:ketol-acid reductoisomerase
MKMKVLYDADGDQNIIKSMTVAVIGYGSQGHAHALNLTESGVKVRVGLRKNGPSWNKAKSAGLEVFEVSEAVKDADIVMLLMPDETIGNVYKTQLKKI